MPAPVVHLSSTTAVKGKCVHSRESRRPGGVYTFLGIPYAEPPVGKLRFQHPQPLQLWKGVKECVEFGPVCPQNLDAASRFIKFDIAPQMNEDCLFLNVYTSTLDKRAKHPVMFWIHGGGFMSGFSNDFEGTSLCNFNDVVYVSINYRLGLFGFSVTGDIVKGNMGMFDQLEALKWVQKYIGNFGGDPNNVTIFGESAGGMSCSLHILSPYSKGLFHKAIFQSGANGNFSLMWPKNNAKKYVLGKMKKLGLKDASTEQSVVNFMRTISTAELISDKMDSYMPILDHDFLPDTPTNLYKQGKFNKDVDVIMGFNHHEGSLFVFRMFDQKNQPNTLAKAKALLDIMVDVRFLRGVPNRDHVKKVIIDHYIGKVKDGDEDGFLKALIEIYGDIVFIAPTIFCALEHAKQGSGHTYVYEFTHKRPDFPYSKDWIGADHLEEIPYVLGKPFQQKYKDIYSEEDREFSKNVMEMWSNFATSGNPNGAIITEWPLHSQENKECMELHPNFKVNTDVHSERMRLWNQVIPSIVCETKSKY